jgi:hypothetical protein
VKVVTEYALHVPVKFIHASVKKGALIFVSHYVHQKQTFLLRLPFGSRLAPNPWVMILIILAAMRVERYLAT